MIENPTASKYSLADIITKKFPTEALGPSGVYNVLRRLGLTLPEDRIVYARANVDQAPSVKPVFIDRLRYVLEQFIPSLAPAPPPQLGTILNFLKTFSIASVLSSATIYSFLWWINLLAAQVASVSLGLVFASIALFMGSLFFLVLLS